MKESLTPNPSPNVRCEADRLLVWLSEMLATADDPNVCIVVEEAADTGLFVQITLRGVRQPLAGLELRRFA